MSAERYTLDANILVYAIDPTDPRKHEIARNLWEAARDNPCVLTTQTLAETYNAVSKKKPERAEDAYVALSALSSEVHVVSANVSDFEDAMTAHRSRPVHFWDAMLWSTARRHGCKVIVTENMPDWPLVEGVLYFNPFLKENQSALAKFIL